MALILLVDRISKALENGDFVIGLFLDFSKAFDTINYHILFAKLYHYGIRGCLLDWFKSYLTDRNNMFIIMVILHQHRQLPVEFHRGQYLAHCYFLFLWMT